MPACESGVATVMQVALAHSMRACEEAAALVLYAWALTCAAHTSHAQHGHDPPVQAVHTACMHASASVRRSASLTGTAGLGSRVTVPASSTGWHAADLAGVEHMTAPSKGLQALTQDIISSLHRAPLGRV